MIASMAGTVVERPPMVTGTGPNRLSSRIEERFFEPFGRPFGLPD
tara:strand:- start:129 stop:263 length:135 start_codon:yes stop_codon:yes gene_type:complete